VARSFSAAARKFPAGHINTRAAGGGGGGGGPRLSLLFPVITRHRRGVPVPGTFLATGA